MLAWLAAFAILLNAWAPSISQVLAASEVGYGDICTVHVPGLVSNDTGTPSKAPVKPSDIFEHCAYCLPHPGSTAILAAAPVVLPAPSLHFDYPPRFYRSPAPLFAWSAAAPRAPPVLS